LILGKIVNIGATRFQILSPKCTKFDFGWALPQTPLRKLASVPETTKGPIYMGKGKGRRKDVKGRNGTEL